MKLIDKLFPDINVVVRMLDKDGVVIHEDRSHNVFTNMGRNWLAENNRVLAGGGRKVDNLPYYLAVGQGSDQQTISPPGAGVQTESAAVTYIENPVEVTSGVYLKELDRPTTEPDAYTNRYEVTLATTDVSFGSSTSVPITEFGLVTANATPTTPGGLKTVSGGPYPGTYNNGYLIAYHAIPPVTKTALFRIQILWELRF